MFQKFFTDTLASRFIKKLLTSASFEPIIEIFDSDLILKDAVYIYNNSLIIKGIQTGKFIATHGDAYPGPDIYPNIAYLPKTGETLGRYQIIDYYDKNNQSNNHYTSNCAYYDSKTHYYLGEYIRQLNRQTGINLLPYYNCYNGSNTRIIDTTSEVFTDNYKNIAIPVKFGKIYTIAVDSQEPIRLTTAIYDESIGFIRDGDALLMSTQDYEIVQTSKFSKPFLKYIQPASSAKELVQEKNLKLILRLNKYNDSTITVLEGNYIDSWRKDLHTNYSISDNPSEINHFRNLSLLQGNSKESYAFSPRLLHGLLLATINKQDIIDDNIGYVQSLISRNSRSLGLSDDSLYNIWDKSIETNIIKLADRYLNNLQLRDQDCNLNPDLEKLLLKELPA